jgi:hypothetical protein
MLNWQADQILSYPAKGLSSFTLAKQLSLSGKWGTISTMQILLHQHDVNLSSASSSARKGCCHNDHNGSARVQACLSHFSLRGKSLMDSTQASLETAACWSLRPLF